MLVICFHMAKVSSCLSGIWILAHQVNFFFLCRHYLYMEEPTSHEWSQTPSGASFSFSILFSSDLSRLLIFIIQALIDLRQHHWDKWAASQSAHVKDAITQMYKWSSIRGNEKSEALGYNTIGNSGDCGKLKTAHPHLKVFTFRFF